jgi:hypothetical protein
MNRCADCGDPLPARTGPGRRPTRCTACQKARRNARDRKRYADDPELRQRQLDARRRRYQGNLDREHARSKRYYKEHREEKLRKANARNARRRREEAALAAD